MIPARKLGLAFVNYTAQGFSLIELLVVVVVLLILTILLEGTLTGTGRDRAMTDCRKNLEKIYLALSIYETDNKGAFPALRDAATSAQPLSLLVPKSTTVTEIFICPGSKDPSLPEAESFAARKISYAYYMGRVPLQDGAADILVSDAQVNTNSKTTRQQVFSLDGHRPGNNHGKKGGNLLSVTGEVSESPPLAARGLTYLPGVQLLNP